MEGEEMSTEEPIPLAREGAAEEMVRTSASATAPAWQAKTGVEPP